MERQTRQRANRSDEEALQRREHQSTSSHTSFVTPHVLRRSITSTDHPHIHSYLMKNLILQQYSFNHQLKVEVSVLQSGLKETRDLLSNINHGGRRVSGHNNGDISVNENVNDQQSHNTSLQSRCVNLKKKQMYLEERQALPQATVLLRSLYDDKFASKNRQ